MKRLLNIAFLSPLLLLPLIGCARPAAPAGPISTPAPVATTSVLPTPSPSVLSADNPAWVKVVDAAKREGQVVIYSTMATPQFRQAIEQTFTKKYGVKAEWVVATGAENKEKLAAEQRSKQYVGDIYHGGYTPVLDMLAKNMLSQFRPPVVEETAKDVWEVSPYEVDNTGHIIVTEGTIILYLVINTDLVKPQEYPQSYHDLLDLKWRGKIVMFDLTTGGTGSLLFTRLAEDPSYGLDYWRKMAKQDVQFQGNYDAVDRAVAVGERSIGLAGIPSAAQRYLQAGAPIKLWYPPQDGRSMNLTAMSIVNNPPHPNAAQLLVNFILTKEGQDLLDVIGDHPIRKDAKFEAHSQFMTLADVPLKFVYSRSVAEKASGYLLNRTAAGIFGLGK